MYLGNYNIPDGNGLKLNGTQVDKIMVGLDTVWQNKEAPGNETFTASGTFVVPAGYTSIDIDMMGAGGNASRTGGFAAQRITQSISVTSGETLTITVAATTTQGASSIQGNSGTYTANGGSGGYTSGASSNCFVGPSYNSYAYAYSGQSSAWGAGGNRICNGAAGNGGVGAGGGGAVARYNGWSNPGEGGRGEIRIVWR